MDITCISDLHGHYPELEGGDLLIVSGDLTARDTEDDWDDFISWIDINEFQYKKVIIISGNHDNYLYDCMKVAVKPRFCEYEHIDYLCDSGTEFEYEEDIEEDHKFKGSISYKQKRKLKIWGSPWTKTFAGMNPHCKAFTCDTEEELAEKWKLIPEDTDILICHSPMWGFGDGPNAAIRLGSTSLLKRHVNYHLNKLKLFVCGHIHEGYRKYDIRELQKKIGDPIGTVHVNASHVNEHYQPVNKPIRVIL